MNVRTRTTAAILTLLGASALNEASAQPVVPMRPTYGGYGGFFGYGRGNYFYGNNAFGMGGLGGMNNQMLMQNLQLQQQLNMTNQSIANLQNFLTTGVNPNLPITGHGATFNNLSHWYNNPPTRGGGGGGFYGGGLPTSGLGMVQGGGMTGNRAAGGGGTAGSGVPVVPTRPANTGQGGPNR